jgi:hypothetical protein
MAQIGPFYSTVWCDAYAFVHRGTQAGSRAGVASVIVITGLGLDSRGLWLDFRQGQEIIFQNFYINSGTHPTPNLRDTEVSFPGDKVTGA